MRDINPRIQPPIEIDIRLVKGNGLRILEGKHITIYTDVPANDVVEELPEIFDTAVPLWCEYFGIDVAKAKPWKMQAFLIRDKSRFEKAGLVPPDLPQFPAGINRGHEIWFFIQPDAYYTRHLMLHEGTHAFMQWFLNGLGAPWYAEGMAELLGLHRWKDGELRLNHRINAPTESEGWGRPKLIKEWMTANEDGDNDKPLQDILLTPNRAFGNVENYAWAWAACEFLSQHPLSKDRFAKMQQQAPLSPENFNTQFLKVYSNDIDVLERDWAWFIRELDYGYSPDSAMISELRSDEHVIEYALRTDRSWQYLKKQVKAGDKYRIVATGRFLIGNSFIDGKPRPWPCEANGITIEYYRDRPIGELQAMILPLTGRGLLPAICQQTPVTIGPNKVITADADGLLCFRINESPSNLSDNRGVLKLAIEKVD